MTDFIDEVNEELRRERLAKSWQKVGRYIVALSLGIILATIAAVLWKQHRQDEQKAVAMEYFAAEKLRIAKKSLEAETAFASIAQKHTPGFADLAELKRANALKEADKTEEAMQLYVNLAQDVKADEGLRHFARIYAAQAMAEAKKPYADIEKILKPTLEEKQSPFSSLAREQLALAALSTGDSATAKKLFEEIAADPKAQASMKRRAEAEAGSLTVHSTPDHS